MTPISDRYISRMNEHPSLCIRADPGAAGQRYRKKITSAGMITLRQNVTDTFLLTLTTRLNTGQNPLTTLGACRVRVEKF